MVGTLSHSRRAAKFNHAAIELREEHYAAEWPALAIVSGDWVAGIWKSPKAWCIEAAIHFRMPVWGVTHTEAGDAVLTVSPDRWRPSPYVEHWQHWVYAKDRTTAIACLVRDINRDERAEFISHAAIYRVSGPQPAAVVREIEAINGRLIREREERRDRQEPRAPQKQLAFC
jgi:hypothetical protein